MTNIETTQAIAERMWVIAGPMDPLDETKHLYWNNDFGWVGEEMANLYTDAERNATQHLPVESIGWEEV